MFGFLWFYLISCEYNLYSNLQLKENYFNLLKENPSITESTTWDDVKQEIKSDRRYQEVHNESLNERWYNEYVLAKVSIHLDTHEDIYGLCHQYLKRANYIVGYNRACGHLARNTLYFV